MFKNILVVCVGNICRSPTAECLLHHSLISQKINVSSAGIAALVGHKMDATAAEVLVEHGYHWPQHQARQLTKTLIHDNDLILVMEDNHIEAVLDIAPEARGKIFLLSHWLQQENITDPYRRSKALFQHVYQLIDQACNSWVKRLE